MIKNQAGSDKIKENKTECALYQKLETDPMDQGYLTVASFHIFEISVGKSCHFKLTFHFPAVY